MWKDEFNDKKLLAVINNREQLRTATNHSDNFVVPFVYKRPALQTAANNREQKANKNLH